MTKTVTSNYSGITAPGNAFNQRIDADSDPFARNDIDALGNGLELHNHASGKGLAVNTIPSGGLTITFGNLGIGAAALSYVGVSVPSTSLGSNGGATFGMLVTPVGPSGATVQITGVASQPGTTASSFTCTTVACFRASDPVKGASSTITSAYGFFSDQIDVGGTNNYGLYIAAPANGTGDIGSAIGGDVMLGGSAVASGVTTGATVGFVWISSCAGIPTGVPRAIAAGGMSTGHVPLCYDRTNNNLYIYNSGWKKTTVFS